jgi:hypothetical protein
MARLQALRNFTEIKTRPLMRSLQKAHPNPPPALVYNRRDKSRNPTHSAVSFTIRVRQQSGKHPHNMEVASIKHQSSTQSLQEV